MGLLLLLTSTLLSSYFYPGRAVNADRSFVITKVTLSIEPSTDVAQDTNVTLRCQATIASSGEHVLSREYTIYKDGNVVYTKTSSTSEDLLYPLPEARVSNTGKYMCKINIKGEEETSGAKKLTVTGLSKPGLHMNSTVVSEGEEVTATCTAPGETGSFFFYFYKDSKEILDKRVNSNQAEAKFRFNSAGSHQIHCSYTVLIPPDSYKSEESVAIKVSVKELPIAAVLKIVPQNNIYEGDRLDISCTVSNFMYRSERVHLYLRQGTKLLSSSGDTKINHSMVALAKDPGEFECGVKIGSIVKVDNKAVSVIELFSVPTLTMSPAEVFQKENMTLTCKSENYASERLGRQELTYTLDPPDSFLIPKDTGVFFGKPRPYEFNYTCVAQARGIMKHSRTLTVRAKLSVSAPKISVVGRAIQGRPSKILCQSDTGSLPINYTLLMDDEQLSTISVKLRFQKALFTVTITKPGDVNKYTCEAKNNHRAAPRSRRLNATVIEPLRDPTVTVIPNLPDISEGDHLILICGVKGSPPVNFTWFLVGKEVPLYNTPSDRNNTSYQIPISSKEHSGAYYCEAANQANVVRSEPVIIEVRLALWKKALIGGFCLLMVSLLVVVCVLRFRSKRGKREAAAELSVKPSSPKSDDSLTVNLTHDTEIYNAATDAAPLYEGMEGRVTNGARDSTASLPADISNRSSYSIPATV
ncbi:platelet endothelial cell adhesion molecule isoform X3 [Pempheris klunzingeri]|uniref:platelet endothelial cell adhesion molecule isoform X3 n=1 Tax=Pempheris klunzingeri TaxID=3127111 RepID=UPI0039801B9C